MDGASGSLGTLLDGVNKLFRFGNAVNGMSSSVVSPAIVSRENVSGVCEVNAGPGVNVFLLEEVTPATVGINASGKPLAVPSPVTIQ